MATKKNITKGYNAVDTLFLRSTESVDTSGNGNTYIRAEGLKDDVDINIIPKGEGIVNIGGVLFSADNSIAVDRLEVEELITNSSNSVVTSFSQGVSGTVFEINSGETDFGVSGDEISGIKVDRGLLDDQFCVWDEADNFWKIGEETDLKRLPVIESWVNRGVVSYDDMGDLVAYDNFLADATSVSISGQLYKNGDNVLSESEINDTFVHRNKSEFVSGDKWFTDDVAISGQCDVEGNVVARNLLAWEEVFVREGTEWVPMLSQNDGDALYVSLTETQDVSGSKTFIDETIFNDTIDAVDIEASGNISTDSTFVGDGSGITKILGPAISGADIPGEITAEKWQVDSPDAYMTTTTGVSGSGYLAFKDQHTGLTLLNDIKDAVDNFVPKTGGSFTGPVTMADDLTLSSSLVFGAYTATGVVTNLSSAASDKLASSLAIKNYVDSATGGVSTTVSTKPDKFSATIGDGSTNPITVSHGIGTEDVIVSVREVATGDFVDAEVSVTDSNNILLTFSSAPTLNEFRVVVIG